MADEIPESWTVVHRVDFASGDIGMHRRTPQGGLVASANLTRTGVLEYVQPDGSIRRELRHPDEVFNPDSLDSLAHAPVTIDHPQKVTPENWKHVSVGHVAGRPKRSGKFVAGEVHIQDAAAMRMAEDGKLQELSCGYSCHLDPTPGEFEGQPYDAVQRRIVYNHVAAGPQGWGRAGPEVRLHLDSGASVSGAPADSYVRDMPMTSEEKAELDQARKDAAEAKASNSRLQGELDALKNAQTEAARQTQDATEKAKFDAAVEAAVARRVELTQLAASGRRFLGDAWKADAKDAVAIQREIIAKLQPEMAKRLDGKDANYVAGVYAMALESAGRTTAVHQQLATITAPHVVDDGAGAGDRSDKRDDDDPDKDKSETDKAYDSMCKDQKERWKTNKRDRRAAADGRR